MHTLIIRSNAYFAILVRPKIKMSSATASPRRVAETTRETKPLRHFINSVHFLFAEHGGHGTDRLQEEPPRESFN